MLLIVSGSAAAGSPRERCSLSESLLFSPGKASGESLRAESGPSFETPSEALALSYALLGLQRRSWQYAVLKIYLGRGSPADRA